MTLRAALYHRVSTTDQDPTLARAELRQAAARMGADVALDIEETGSGARNDRPGLQRILEAARRSKIDLVLVWKLDRFGRSALDLQTNINALNDAGVRFIATSQGLTFDGSAMGKLMIGVMAAVAEFERDLIVERTRLGLQKARQAGKRIGRPPTADPDRARLLRASGASWTRIAAELGCSESAARRAAATLPKPDPATAHSVSSTNTP